MTPANSTAAPEYFLCDDCAVTVGLMPRRSQQAEAGDNSQLLAALKETEVELLKLTQAYVNAKRELNAHLGFNEDVTLFPVVVNAKEAIATARTAINEYTCNETANCSGLNAELLARWDKVRELSGSLTDDSVLEVFDRIDQHKQFWNAHGGPL